LPAGAAALATAATLPEGVRRSLTTRRKRREAGVKTEVLKAWWR